ncbi:putative PAS/PAC sensor protein [Methanolacinia petrolearia DSM 11571]|uniref:Putative PAS/PAC sensor protein n=1 Tax=Methanolacinia petrolearia (strain DSM 11571 / OCM 486 / SEBR 4847) TaxID=679926 RepID=E1RFB7_METP4|nr:response regulator [Methanolacinia petrolearia]ADN35065.1 putative PAS/PAC sensor protein [Methanolacinia petrolearia DSM 11571]
MIDILIVDDDPEVLDITKIFLERTGYFRVSTGNSAAEGLLKLEEQNFEAVISDYEMPDMNGLDFLKEIREEGNIIPFIIFTGRSREEVVIEAMNSGADYYIQKGTDLKALFAELTHKVLLAVEKKRSEKALSEANEYKNRLIESHIDPLLTIDDSYKIMDINSAMEKLSGYRKDEIEGKDLAVLFRDHENAKSALAIALKENNLRDYPLDIVTSYGEVIPILFHAAPYINEKMEFLGFFTEFHEYKEDKNEHAGEKISKNEFYLDILTHDIRNMIMVETGCLEIDGNPEEEQSLWERRMRNLIGNVKHLIENTEAMRRSDENCHDLKPVELRPLICREAENYPDLDITIGDFGCMVVADDLLGSVFYNLFNNVKKHCGAGTEVRISVPEYEEGSEISVFFEDSGPGIPNDIIEDFNVGDLAENGSSGKKSHGMGLIWSLIDNCGGQIMILTNEGRTGTKYIISLKKHFPYEESLLLSEKSVCLKNR